MTEREINELDESLPLREQASYWWILLNGAGASAADHRAFGQWAIRSPERIAAFLRTVRLSQGLQSQAIRWPDTPADVLVRQAMTPRADVLTLRTAGSGSGPANGRYRRLRVAAVFIVAVLAVVWIGITRPLRYTTAVGEQRSVVLSDGSIVTLNTSSRIEVRFDQARRTVRLLSGEGLFQVARDTRRPFEVIAGTTAVRALGTEFNVDLRATSTTVTVVEGAVSIDSRRQGASPAAGALTQERSAGQEPIELSAGERLTVVPNLRPHPARADLVSATAWTQRRLVFQRRALGEVAAEFNRYNRHTIEFDSPELRDLKVTGTFQANDPDSFIAFVAKLRGVRIARDGEVTRVTVN